VIEEALAHWRLLCQIKEKKRRLKKLILQQLEIVVLARNVTNTIFIASPSQVVKFKKLYGEYLI
jgi:hypothetical protein